MRYNIKRYLAGTLLFLLLFTACKEEDMALGEGSVRLSVRVSDDVAVVTRSVDAGIYNSMQTRIYSSKGLVRYYDATTPIPETLNLASGQYHVFVLAGDSVPAAFNTPYYTGSTDFDVRSGEITTASVTCTVANTLATVAFDPGLNEVVTDCKVKIFTTNGELYFTEATADSVGYYLFNGKDHSLAWSFEGKKTDGSSYTQSGVVEDVQRATKYAFTFSYNAESAATGGTFLDVKVNESTVDSTHNVVITQRPQIAGDKFDLTETLYYETNGGSQTAVWVNAATRLQRVWFSCDKLTALGFPTDSIDFLAADGSPATEFESRGRPLQRQDYPLGEFRQVTPERRIYLHHQGPRCCRQGQYRHSVDYRVGCHRRDRRPRTGRHLGMPGYPARQRGERDCRAAHLPVPPDRDQRLDIGGRQPFGLGPVGRGNRPYTGYDL